MPLVPFAELVNSAYAGGYAVPHFNICNLETVKAIADAAEETRSPVIFGVHTVESNYAGTENIVGIIRSVIGTRNIFAAIHLDHGPSFERTVECIRAGYTSVMFDGSMIPLEQNLAITRDVVKVAKPAGVSVEAEIGSIGNTAEYGEATKNPHLADPAAAEAMAETGIDALAIAIGNAHGVYLTEPKLDFDLLAEIRKRVDIPLVLHGGTGIPRDQVQTAIAGGVAKFNIGTALHVAFTNGIKSFMAAQPESHNIMDMLAASAVAVRAVALDVIDMTMSAGRA
jgi:fructose-bisphosphate aldolase class II